VAAADKELCFTAHNTDRLTITVVATSTTAVRWFQQLRLHAVDS